VEQLYHVLTGTRPPASNGQRVAFPPEVDPIVHVHEQLGGMLDRVDDGVLAIRIHPSPRTQPSQIMITS
jgi:hypothetical protein